MFKRLNLLMSRFIQSLINRECVLTWPRSANDSPSRVVARGVDC